MLFIQAAASPLTEFFSSLLLNQRRPLLHESTVFSDPVALNRLPTNFTLLLH